MLVKEIIQIFLLVTKVNILQRKKNQMYFLFYLFTSLLFKNLTLPATPAQTHTCMRTQTNTQGHGGRKQEEATGGQKRKDTIVGIAHVIVIDLSISVNKTATLHSNFFYYLF